MPLQSYKIVCMHKTLFQKSGTYIIYITHLILRILFHDRQLTVFYINTYVQYICTKHVVSVLHYLNDSVEPYIHALESVHLN